MPAELPTDATLARDYPKALREAYRAAVRRNSAGERHAQLLRLGEVSIIHLTSLAFADYRRSRVDDPDPAVEEFIATNTRLTLGLYLALFRLSQKALGRSEIFGIQRHEVNVRLDSARRWLSAVRSVEYAHRVGATDIEKVIEEGLKEPTKAIRWLTFWDEFVRYRNRIAHPDSTGWYSDAAGYYEAMVGPLESALVEALRTEYIEVVLLEYPIAELVDIRRTRTGWMQRFDGEYRGVPLLETIERAGPPERWESDIGCQYVLQREATGWTPHSRFADLREGPPGPVATVVPAQEPRNQPQTAPAVASAAPQVLTDQHDRVPPQRKARGRIAAPRSIAHRSAPINPASNQHWFPSLRVSFSPWMLWCILSAGLLAGVGFLHVASQVRDVRLRNFGFAYLFLAVLTLTFFGLSDQRAHHQNGFNTSADILLVVGWIGSSVHAMVVNPRVRAARQA